MSDALSAEVAAEDARLRIDIFAELQERVQFGALALAGFDPLKASDGELRAHALPPQPDAGSLRRAFANWKELMSPPFALVPPPRQAEEFFTIPLRARQHILIKKTNSFIGDRSSNWSGAALRSPIDNLCCRVYGSWTVPRAEPPPEAHRGGSWSDGTWYSSAWAGLDGHIPGSIAMPQMGTQHIAATVNGKLTSSAKAWWQWWLRDQASNQQIELPLAVHPGDRVQVLITVLDPRHVNFFFKNLDLPLPNCVSFDSSAPALPGSSPERVEQQTVEWVLERQTEPDGTDLRPFNNFRSCHFHNCGAVMADASSVPFDVNLLQAGLIEMVDWIDPKNPGRVVSIPQKITSPAKLNLSYVVGVP